MPGGGIESEWKMFQWATMKRHWALIPTVAITCGACAMCGAYITYMAVSKHDYSLRPWSWSQGDQPYKDVDPKNVSKLFVKKPPKPIDPEILALRREIGSYKEAPKK